MLGTFALVESNSPLPIPAYTGETLPILSGNSLLGFNYPFFSLQMAVLGDLMAEDDIDAKNEVLAFISEINGLDEILYSLAQCESGFRNICVIDTNNKLSCGLFQFQKSTWDAYCEKEWLSNSDQIKCAGQLVLAGFGESLWRNCWKIISTK